MGSVKDLTVIKAPTATEMGIGQFTFSDRYSVFDWGEMPDHIPYKGKALCFTSAYFFKQLEKAGIKTHYTNGGYAEPGSDSYFLGGIPSNKMTIKLVNMIRPDKKTSSIDDFLFYDYSKFQDSELMNFLIPLEFIYRNGLPEGSSVFKRLKDGSLTIHDLGLDHEPQPGEVFAQPYFDVSTKLEEGDRYLSWDEARKISGMTAREVKQLQERMLYMNNIISNSAEVAGMINWDGKFEFAFDSNGELMVVDTLGTLDESRFTYDGQHVSKEINRQHYKRTQPEWVEQIDKAKKSGAYDWKSLVHEQPRPLPQSLVDITSNMYISAANALTNSKAFSAPPLGEVVCEYKKYLETFE